MHVQHIESAQSFIFRESKLDQAKPMIKEDIENAVITAVATDPTMNIVKNTLGAIQDYQHGEPIEEIVKDRYF